MLKHTTILFFSLLISTLTHAQEKDIKVEHQPLAAQVKRVMDALDYLGEPLPKEDKQQLQAAFKDKQNGVATIQRILGRHTITDLHIKNEREMVSLQSKSSPQLAEQGWRSFLVKVLNPKGIKGVELRALSPNARLPYKRSSNKPDPKVEPVANVKERFLELAMFNSQPLVRNLSGLEVEYRIVQIYSRDAGRKPAKIRFGLFRGARSNNPIALSKPDQFVFKVAPAVLVKLQVHDHDGKPAMASFVFRDEQGRVHPAQTKRLAPDFFFHSQIYRANGETVQLQPGKYTVECTRGPEYYVLKRTITVPKADTHLEVFRLKRWVHPAKKGWWSGDHHIHAAGCAHYESPTEGVTPEDMMRHVLGEDLNVGCCLSWGPCWYHQKRYFDGKVHSLSTENHLLRYDVEVSGFPSSHAGHICLLRLREQDYPGTKLISDWPSWDLPIFKWAKSQGAVVGFAHSGWGLNVPSATTIPNDKIPPMDSIGANEYIMDVTHGMVDFISTVDTPSVSELNIWYHTLNCGYRCRISGETDFPCIFGEKVGLGRSYVHLKGKLNFDEWAEGIKKGRCYVSDGKSHLMDFQVNDVVVGTSKSEVKLKQAGKVTVKANVAALLEPKPTPQTESIRKRSLYQKPYWDLERSRIDQTRKVPVELIVNGQPVAKKEIVADGSMTEVKFEVQIKQSSWVCLRVLPSSHTNPVFVLVNDKPIRASKKSAEWCLKSLDQCEKMKMPRIRKEEKAAAKAAYAHARREYQKILKECNND